MVVVFIAANKRVGHQIQTIESTTFAFVVTLIVPRHSPNASQCRLVTGVSTVGMELMLEIPPKRYFLTVSAGEEDLVLSRFCVSK